MDITEMNGGCAPCALRLKNQTISFPTMDGLLWVNPEKAIPLLPEGNVYVDEFTAGSSKINPDSLEDISVPSTDRDITIKIGFSAWCNKENVYLEYQLNNNKNWVAVDVNNGAYIRLNNLDPGSYKIRIRKMNGFGIDNYSYKEIALYGQHTLVSAVVVLPAKHIRGDGRHQCIFQVPYPAVPGPAGKTGTTGIRKNKRTEGTE